MSDLLVNVERVLFSKLSEKETPAVCLSVFLLARLLQHKDRHLIIDCSTGCEWTGKELHDCTLSVADAFINLFDLNGGDSVAMWAPNSDVHAIAFMATIAAAAVYVPIDLDYVYGILRPIKQLHVNDPYIADKVHKVVKLSSAKFLVCHSDYKEDGLKLLDELDCLQRVFIIGETDSVEEEEEDNDDKEQKPPKRCHNLMDYMRYKCESWADSRTKPLPIPVPVNSHDICVIHFAEHTIDCVPYQLTPIIRTNANLIHSSYQLHHSDLFDWTNDDCLLVRHFFDHLGLILFCHSLVSGNKVAMVRHGLVKQQSMQSLAKHRITCVAIGLKELLYLLRNDVEIRSSEGKNLSNLYHDFSTVTDILYTGPPLPHPEILLEELFRKVKPLYFRIIYGRPETGIISCGRKRLSMLTDVNISNNLFPSFGHLVAGVQLKIIHPKTQKARLMNKMGEICVKTKQMIDSDKNHRIVTEKGFTDDGFFRTGDAGYYDKEGLIHLQCRVDECIYEDKAVVDPHQLESLLAAHPQVKEVAVIGVPDTRYGQVCCAFVVRHLLNQTNQTDCQQILIEYLANRAKHLRAGIRFLWSIPRTNRNQINRMSLRDIYQNFQTYSFLELL